jgi:broad specificity phosphatase PhoE
MTRAIIIRHARAVGNPDHRFIGQLDVALDTLGRQQAEALARRLKTLSITRIVSSDLQRAVDTASPTATELGLVLETDVRLREINNGEWSGLLPSEIEDRWPEMWASYMGGADVKRPGGESWVEVRNRVIEAVQEHISGNELIAVFTHGGPALNLAIWAMGIPAGGNVFRGRMSALANTAITVIEMTGPRLLVFNDIGHLDGLLPDGGMPFDTVKD